MSSEPHNVHEIHVNLPFDRLVHGKVGWKIEKNMFTTNYPYIENLNTKFLQKNKYPLVKITTGQGVLYQINTNDKQLNRIKFRNKKRNIFSFVRKRKNTKRRKIVIMTHVN